MIKNLTIGGSNRTMLMLALLFGLVCAVLVGVYLSGLNSDDSTAVSTASVPVVVANQDIPSQTTLTAEMLTIKEIPETFVLAGGFADPAELVGHKSQVALVNGQQLLATNTIDADSAVSAFGEDAPLSLVIPDGKRAFAIYISPVAAVGGLARSGDRVDIIVSTTSTTANEAGEQVEKTSACYALQDIQVLAMGSTLLKPAAEGDATAIAGVETNPETNAMTLAVTNGEAVQLAAAQGTISDASVGNQLWVVLRAFGDHNPNTDLPTCPVNTGS